MLLDLQVISDKVILHYWRDFFYLNGKLLCKGDENVKFVICVLQLGLQTCQFDFSDLMPSKYKYPNI